MVWIASRNTAENLSVPGAWLDPGGSGRQPVTTKRSTVPKRFLCSIHAVTSGQTLRVDLSDGVSLTVYNLSNSFYASDNLCTHGDASLAEGEIDGDTIVCPFHGGSFDIKTGAPIAPPCIVPLKTYPVSVEGDQIFVELG